MSAQSQDVPNPFDKLEHLLKPAEVAALFRVDPKTVTRWSKPGDNGEPPKLPSLRTLGGHRRFKESVVQAELRRFSTELGVEVAVIDAAAAAAVAPTPAGA